MDQLTKTYFHQLIHSEVATVVKVSKIYETPAWGFESEPFFNAAILIHTTKSMEDQVVCFASIRFYIA